jgi:hypothetical protein
VSKICKFAKLLASIVGGWWSLMSGALSIPIAVLAIYFGGSPGFWLAVLAFAALWVIVIRTAWKNHQLMEVLKESPCLEIEPIPSEKFPAKKHPLHIRVLNKNPKLNADDLKVEIVSFADNLAAQFQSVAQRYYHPSHFDKVAELKSATGKNTINPNDGLEFTVFYFEASWKIQGHTRSVVATFDLKGVTVKENVASFHEGKKYQIKFAASARGFSRIEREFNMEFFDDDGICKIKLTPFEPLTKQEIRQKSEADAVEKIKTDKKKFLHDSIVSLQNRMRFLNGAKRYVEITGEHKKETYDLIQEIYHKAYDIIGADAAGHFTTSTSTQKPLERFGIVAQNFDYEWTRHLDYIDAHIDSLNIIIVKQL